jgi:hypothetical protein
MSASPTSCSGVLKRATGLPTFILGTESDATSGTHDAFLRALVHTFLSTSVTAVPEPVSIYRGNEVNISPPGRTRPGYSYHTTRASLPPSAKFQTPLAVDHDLSLRLANLHAEGWRQPHKAPDVSRRQFPVTRTLSNEKSARVSVDNVISIEYLQIQPRSILGHVNPSHPRSMHSDG